MGASTQRRDKHTGGADAEAHGASEAGGGALHFDLGGGNWMEIRKLVHQIGEAQLRIKRFITKTRCNFVSITGLFCS